jgi:DNA-binding NarL/FixJ family response regulator
VEHEAATFANLIALAMNIRVAIVDDKPTNYFNLIDKLSLKSEVEILFTASNGEAFLERMKMTQPLPDVVFMDIDMPVMDGIEAVSAGAELYPDVKFIMLTVFDDDDKIFEAIKAGAIGYLLKDEKAERLLMALEEVMEFGGAPMSPRIARKSLQLLTKGPQKPETASPLSDREVDILKGMVEGLDYKMLAERLCVSPHTVRTHINNIYKKLHVNNKTQAVKIAMKRGWF